MTRFLVSSGFVVPRVERSGILAASWLSSKWPDRAPEGRILLRTFCGGARDPSALDQSDDELVALSLRALTPLLVAYILQFMSWRRASVAQSSFSFRSST